MNQQEQINKLLAEKEALLRDIAELKKGTALRKQIAANLRSKVQDLFVTPQDIDHLLELAKNDPSANRDATIVWSANFYFSKITNNIEEGVF